MLGPCRTRFPSSAHGIGRDVAAVHATSVKRRESVAGAPHGAFLVVGILCYAATPKCTGPPSSGIYDIQPHGSSNERNLNAAGLFYAANERGTQRPATRPICPLSGNQEESRGQKASETDGGRNHGADTAQEEEEEDLPMPLRPNGFPAPTEEDSSFSQKAQQFQKKGRFYKTSRRVLERESTKQRQQRRQRQQSRGDKCAGPSTAGNVKFAVRISREDKDGQSLQASSNRSDADSQKVLQSTPN